MNHAVCFYQHHKIHSKSPMSQVQSSSREPARPWANSGCSNQDSRAHMSIRPFQSYACPPSARQTSSRSISPSMPSASGFTGSHNICSYYMDRGNGQYTRLIPADLLPLMNDVLPREARHENMVVLPPLVMSLGEGNENQGYPNRVGNTCSCVIQRDLRLG